MNWLFVEDAFDSTIVSLSIEVFFKNIREYVVWRYDVKERHG